MAPMHVRAVHVGTLSCEIDERLRCLESRLADARERYRVDDDFWNWFHRELRPIEAQPMNAAERAAFQLRVTLMIAEHPSTDAPQQAA
ncbi:hypothetical protein E4582_08450 [Luteimonas yindakuii]|uniref:Uncharacterized protein n=1 Tax=Luteimonas yindakuii TaxID=2565782 RepID=A0A4Z1RJ84_9GAMM|nr:hypothetical protein [Luteimonas yindakuii]TKS54787.1 hypothetical protein E4582_08450 [Luteimonas yindakuii]